MTDSLDARIRRVCAEMIDNSLHASWAETRRNTDPMKTVDAANWMLRFGIAMHVIATAPAEATKSDQPAIPAHLVPEGGLSAVIGPTRAGGPDHIGQAGERPATSPSPSDPFAPMVEAAINSWHLTNIPSQDRMRRALSAALHTAPCTEAIEMAGMVQSTMSNSWRAMCDALADELEGGP